MLGPPSTLGGQLAASVSCLGFLLLDFLTRKYLRARIEWVVLPNHLRHLAFVPYSQRFIHSNETEHWTDILWTTPVEVLVFDGQCRPPRASASLWTRSSPVMMVVSNQTIRGLLPSSDTWLHFQRGVTHSKTGGVTTWACVTHFYLRRESYIESLGDIMTSFIPVELFRGARSFLFHLIDKRESSRIQAPPPLTNELGGELEPLPYSKLQQIRPAILTLPTVYGKDNFCRRPLTAKEGCGCLDIPRELYQGWNDAMSWGVVRSIANPLKVTTALAWTLKALIQSHMLRSTGTSKRASLEETKDMAPAAKRHQVGSLKRPPRSVKQERLCKSITSQHWAGSPRSGWQPISPQTIWKAF
ncbi:hypothetical protein ACA910_004904 [Epithemia clementina (nom. ined.)]